MDTGAYFALSFSGDENHRSAVSVLRNLTSERRRLVTSNFVLAETHALLLNRLNRDIALRVLESIHASSTRIVRVRASDEMLARDLLRTHADKNYSLTDAASFVIMTRLGISTAFAFDRHISQYGFHTVGQRSSR